MALQIKREHKQWRSGMFASMSWGYKGSWKVSMGFTILWYNADSAWLLNIYTLLIHYRFLQLLLIYQGLYPKPSESPSVAAYSQMAKLPQAGTSLALNLYWSGKEHEFGMWHPYKLPTFLSCSRAEVFDVPAMCSRWISAVCPTPWTH